MKFRTIIGGACLMLATLALGGGSYAQGNGALLVALNKTAFHAGDTMRVTATLTAIAPARRVDAYVVVQLPNGSLFSLQLGGALVPGVVPIARSLVPSEFTGSVAQYVFNGAEPAGRYTWLYALTEPGTRNVIGTLGRTSFTVGDGPVSEPIAVLIPNADTNAVAVVSLPDGSSTTYFGPKNAAGIPLRISEAVTIGSDHLRAHQTFNDVGAPVAVDGSDGSRASFEYSAPNRVNLTLTPLSGASFVVSVQPANGRDRV